MSYQVFTRKPGKSPRRVEIVATYEGAADYCKGRNAQRTARQIRERFFYEFANLAWYCKAFGR